MLGDAWEDLGVLDPALFGTLCFTFLGQSNLVEEEEGIVLAGTGGPGAAGGHWYKSIDFGRTWVDKGSTPGAEAYFMDLVNIGNGVVVAAMGPNDSDVERSASWGDQFVFITELDPLRRSCNSGTYCGNNIVLVGTNGTLFPAFNATVHRSIDGGLIWDAGQAITTSPLDICTALKYLENGIVLAGTSEGEIARSTDSGASWTLNIKDIGGGINDIYDFAYLGGGVVLLSSRQGQIWRSADHGQTWTHIATPGGTFLRSIIYVPALPGIESMVFVCASGGHVYRSLDGGYNWTDLGLILPGIAIGINSLCYFTSKTEQVLLAGYFSGIAGDARIARTSEPIPYLGTPDNLLCEQKKNPTDVQDPFPEFSAVHHFE